MTRLLTTATLLLLGLTASGQERLIQGQVTYDLYEFERKFVMVFIYRHDSIVSTTFADSTGLFPIVVFDKLSMQDSTKLDSVKHNASEYVNLKPIEPGTYDLVIRHNGIRTKIINNLTLDLTTPLDLKFSYPDPCPQEYKDYRATRDTATTHVSLVQNNCPLGHADDIIQIKYGLFAGLDGSGRPGGCLVGPCDPHWYCNRHQIEY